jgi:hypothetical protein
MKKSIKSQIVPQRMSFNEYKRQHAQALNRVLKVDNEPPALIANEGAAIQPGVMYLANESVFTQQYFDEPLTNYAIGWRDPNNIEETLEFFAPSVPVPRRFTYKSWTNIEEFLSEDSYEDLRAIGGEFATVKYTGSEIHARTDNRGLRIRVDLDEVADPNSALAGGIATYQARIVEKLKRRILRNSLRRAISLISAGAINTGVTWNGSTGQDPDNDVLQQILAATTQSGIRPNRVAWGDTAWSKRVLTHRAQNTAGGYASAGLTPEQVGMFLIVQPFVSRERFSATGAPLAEVVGNLVFLFYALAGQDTEDPSNIKRFYSVTDSGGPWRVYVQQVTSKLVDITVEHYELIAVTSLLGLNQLTVS